MSQVCLKRVSRCRAGITDFFSWQTQIKLSANATTLNSIYKKSVTYNGLINKTYYFKISFARIRFHFGLIQLSNSISHFGGENCIPNTAKLSFRRSETTSKLPGNSIRSTISLTFYVRQDMGWANTKVTILTQEQGNFYDHLNCKVEEEWKSVNLRLFFHPSGRNLWTLQRP